MYPLLTNKSPELAAWIEKTAATLGSLAADERATLDQHNSDGTFPRELYRELARLGFVGPAVPAEYGGLGGGVAEYAVVCEEIGRHGLVQIQISAQGQKWLLDWGTDEQREEWLAPLTSGEKIFSESISEKNAGSSFKHLEARAVRDGSDWILKGSKTHVNLGADSDLTLFFALTEQGLTSFLVDMSLPGISTRRTDPIGLRLIPTADVMFDDVRVPDGASLGAPGEGIQTFLTTFNTSRLGNASELIGLGRRALAYGVDYAAQRLVGDDLVTSFQGIQWGLADSWQALTAASLARDYAAITADGGTDIALETSTAKRMAIDAAELSSTSAASLVGGHGLYRDTVFPHVANDIRVLRVAGGSSEVLRNYIARRILKSETFEGLA